MQRKYRPDQMVETFFKDNQKLKSKYPEDELEYQNKIKRKI